MRIDLCGVRGSLPAPGVDFVRYGGQTACVAVTHDEDRQPTLLLDAGTGLVRASALMRGEAFAGTILLSHLHWDHTIGLPFFAAGDRDDARTTLLLPVQESGMHAVDVLGGMMRPPYFPIGPTDLRGDWRFDTIAAGERQVEGFTVLAREIPHKGGRTFGYRVSDGHSVLAYMPDHSPTSLGAGEDGFGEFHPAALELARDADVLIHDSQMFPEDGPAQAGFGHSVADYAVGLGARAGVKSVVLFHHRLDRTDEELDELASRLGGGSPTVSVAGEGLQLVL